MPVLGLIITNFVKMVESKHDAVFLDELITHAQLTDDGAYTEFEKYPDDEIIVLIHHYAFKTNQSKADVWQTFGDFAIESLFNNHPHITQQYDSFYQVLRHLDSDIHPMVSTLYPNSYLPTVSVTQITPSSVQVHYESRRDMADFAQGLITGTARLFSKDITIERTDIGHGSTLFTVSKRETTDDAL